MRGEQPITLVVDPRKLWLTLVGVAGLLHGLSAIAGVIKWRDPDASRTVFNVFDIGEELAIPAWFSSLVLASCAFVLLTIGGRAVVDGLRWRFLGCFALLASLDEAAALHERLIDPLRDEFDLTGVLYFSWVIPGALVVVALAASFAGFARRLPRRYLRCFGLSAALFVTGALFLEGFGGWIASSTDNELLLEAEVFAEEGLEMLGAITLLAGLVRYLQEQAAKRLEGAPKPAEPVNVGV